MFVQIFKLNILAPARTRSSRRSRSHDESVCCTVDAVVGGDDEDLAVFTVFRWVRPPVLRPQFFGVVGKLRKPQPYTKRARHDLLAHRRRNLPAGKDQSSAHPHLFIFFKQRAATLEVLSQRVDKAETHSFLLQCGAQAG